VVDLPQESTSTGRFGTVIFHARLPESYHNPGASGLTKMDQYGEVLSLRLHESAHPLARRCVGSGENTAIIRVDAKVWSKMVKKTGPYCGPVSMEVKRSQVRAVPRY
jgi:hypothetical protein